MTATNDDLLAEMQKQTEILRKIKKLHKGMYANQEIATSVENDAS